MSEFYQDVDQEISEQLFFPRAGTKSGGGNHKDFDIPVERGISLGARFYQKDNSYRTVLFFHGNGEIVTDYDDIAPFFHAKKLNLFVVDYRGYGWSGGTPSFESLKRDPPIVAEFFLKQISPNAPKPILMGRSLGSSPATDLALKYPKEFSALVLESGFADVISLLHLLGVHLPEYEAAIRKEFSNDLKLKQNTLPLLLIHGEKDRLISIDHADTNYEASPGSKKELFVLPEAGHNNLLEWADQYFGTLHQFVSKLP